LINRPSWLNRRNIIRASIGAGIAGLASGIALACYAAFVIRPNLPTLEAVTDYRPKIPLRIYTADKVLIGEFGEEHRDFTPIAEVPDLMKKAVLAIEDSRFYEHGGIDWVRVMGAARANLRGSFRQGGSTITMQVARDFYLSKDKFISRKLAEAMLAYRIEDALGKDKILELYMNNIYLGQRSYGFASAAQAYFGKPLKELSIAETAMLAGLPQNPSRNNPAVNPKKARSRQQVVLRRMFELDYITEAQYGQAKKEQLHINHRGQEFDTHAEYVAELARQVVFAELKEAAYTRGINVYTTIQSSDQEAAYASVRRNVVAYDRLPRPGNLYRPAGRRGRTRRRDRRCAGQARRQRRPDPGRGAGSQPDPGQGRNIGRRRADHQRRWFEACRLGAVGQGQAGHRDPSRRRDPRHAGRQEVLVHYPGAEGGRGLRRAGRQHRRLPGHGRRLRFRPAEIQPRDAGVAPARLVDQAVHLLGRRGERIRPGHRGRRRAAGTPRQCHRPAMDAAKRRRQVRRPGHHAPLAGGIEERAVGAHPARNRPG
jgi:hypothetical protein